MEMPRDKEDALAGALNGVMFTLLGAAGPGLLLWQVVTHWPEAAMRFQSMTAAQAMQGVALLTFSLPVAGFGVRLLRRNMAFLLAR